MEFSLGFAQILVALPIGFRTGGHHELGNIYRWRLKATYKSEMLHNANTPTFVLECEKVLISATNIVDDYCFGGHPRGNS